MTKRAFDPAKLPPVKVLNTMTSAPSVSMRKMMEALACTHLIDHAESVLTLLCDKTFWDGQAEAAFETLGNGDARARASIEKSLGFMGGLMDLTPDEDREAFFARRSERARQAYLSAMESSEGVLNCDLVFGLVSVSVEAELNGSRSLCLSFGSERHHVCRIDLAGFVKDLIADIKTSTLA